MWLCVYWVVFGLINLTILCFLCRIHYWCNVLVWGEHTIYLMQRGVRHYTIASFSRTQRFNMVCVCAITCRFLVRAKRAQSLRASEASYLYFYDHMALKMCELLKLAQKWLKVHREMRNIALKSRISSEIVQWLPSLVLKDCARFARTKNRQLITYTHSWLNLWPLKM